MSENVHGSAAYNNSVLGTIYRLCMMGYYTAYYQKKCINMDTSEKNKENSRICTSQ